jgi:hypothetical protein
MTGNTVADFACFEFYRCGGDRCRFTQEHLETFKLGGSERKRLSVELKLSSGPVGIEHHESRSETRRVEERPEASAVGQG